MFESSQNWELFGYDMRDLGRHWKAAWRDFLWSYDSPVRRRLDEPVRLYADGSVQCFHAGEPCDDSPTTCEAILLPEQLVLSRRLQLPLAVEADLDSVVALEVSARSPFGPGDTVSGWRVVNRGDLYLDLVMVIASKSAAMTHVATHHGSHDHLAQEVWADVDGTTLVVEGFGESRRAALYRKRLMRVTSVVALAAFLLLLSAVTAAGFKKLELGQVQEMATRIESEAATASQYRATLGQANETITVITELAGLYPSPHPELARLTRLLGDDAYVERFSIQGLEIDLRGRAGNAAVMMQELSEQARYVEVTAVSPIRRIPNTDSEQFHLKIKLGGVDA